MVQVTVVIKKKVSQCNLELHKSPILITAVFWYQSYHYLLFSLLKLSYGEWEEPKLNRHEPVLQKGRVFMKLSLHTQDHQRKMLHGFGRQERFDVWWSWNIYKCGSPLSISLGDCSSHPTHPTTNPSRREIECIFLKPLHPNINMHNLYCLYIS